MGILYEAASNLDWSHIEPAIFGTLFERSLNIDKRKLIGAHYTSPEDIMLLIEPVILQPLRRRWDTVQAEVLAALETERAEDAKSTSRQATLRRSRQSEALLEAWFNELAAIRVLDPACGSGNFLYMALRSLLDLWKQARDFGQQNGISLVTPSIIRPRQLFGIETDFYAHELASIVVWIGWLQWMHDHGEPITNEPILEKLTNIEYADAILRYNAEGKPYEPQWPAAEYIVGNPPFLGGKFLRRELGDAYVDALFALYKGRVKAESDLVVYWFEKARAQIEHAVVQRAGLIGTQSIRGGANRNTLQRIQETGNIFWAVSDKKWPLGGAAVQVSLVAFDDGSETDLTLDTSPVNIINADLSTGTNAISAKELSENRSLCFQGTIKGGRFHLDPATAHDFLSRPINVNGKSNADVIVPWMNGDDITGRPRGMYVIDFGASPDLRQAVAYEAPFEYIKTFVKPVREKVNRKNHRDYWWVHAEARPGMRRALNGLTRFIMTPRVSKYRLFTWAQSVVLPDSATYAFARDDDYFFGVLHSKPHELWARAQGTQLREVESGFRYTPNSTFDTFPFPWPPGKEPVDDPRVQAIAAAAKELVELRDRWLNPPGIAEEDLRKRTLTNLYNEHPQWLQDAHGTLDQASSQPTAGRAT